MIYIKVNENSMPKYYLIVTGLSKCTRYQHFILAYNRIRKACLDHQYAIGKSLLKGSSLVTGLAFVPHAIEGSNYVGDLFILLGLWVFELRALLYG